MNGNEESEKGRKVEALEEVSRRIASEAKKTIEAIASRISVSFSFGEKREPPREVDRVVVISDTHFGDPHEVLVSEESISTLGKILGSLGRIDELILLGDVFDFWQVPVEEALSRGRDFIASLFELENVSRIVYIPGNHDHHAFRMYYEEKYLERLRSGLLEPPELEIPLTPDCPVMEPLKPSGARTPLFMAYPVYLLNVRGKEVFFTHGHLLGFFERSIWRPRQSMIATLILSRNESLDLQDMERFLSPFYEMLALSASVPGVTSGGYRLYRLLSRTGKILGLQGDERVSVYRGTTIEENASEIEALIDHFCTRKPDYFVYGHTHRAGKLELPLSESLAVNTGCWLDDELIGEDGNTLLEITTEANLLKIDF